MSYNQTGSSVKEEVENAQDQLSKAAKDAGKQAKRFIKNTQGELEEMANSCCDHIKENPIRSVLLGFAAGVIITKLLSSGK